MPGRAAGHAVLRNVGTERRHRHVIRRAAFVGLAVLAAACNASAATPSRPLARVLSHEYPAAAAASSSASWAPDRAQALYDAARDLENALPSVTSPSCQKLLAALRRFASAEVAAAEWYDRLDSAKSAIAAQAGQRFASQVTASRGSCREGAPVTFSSAGCLSPPARERRGLHGGRRGPRSPGRRAGRDSSSTGRVRVRRFPSRGLRSEARSRAEPGRSARSRSSFGIPPASSWGGPRPVPPGSSRRARGV